jgi:hypothetical protein
VTARAANLAPRDLRVDGRETRTSPGEARDVLALDPDVVEIQHEWVSLAAVRAATLREDRLEMKEVASDLRRPIRALGELVAVSPTPRSSPSGPSPMAVRAHHLAPRDLRVDRRDRRRRADQRCYGRRLVSDVVELENDRIPFAAIDASVLSQEVQDVRSQPALTRSLGGSRLIAMELPTRAEVRSEARPCTTIGALPRGG